jgi:hypothetical protein
MNRYTQASTGTVSEERTLCVKNVNSSSFGKLFSYYVDGAVYPQPLYVPGVPTPSSGVHDLVFIATMNDKVYAFDAKRSGPPVWILLAASK